MVSSYKMTPWLMAIFCLATAGCSNVTDQQTSETQRDQQIAILKQIRKVNEDGSYAYGYEAGDGSFKVESRDVLGNIKGTFGFVDSDGEIKRISYSSSNGTGFKATTVSPLQEHISVVQSIPRFNRTSTTRKPSIVYATSTEAATKSSVVQSIPRARKTTTTSTTTTSTTTTSNSSSDSSGSIGGGGSSTSISSSSSSSSSTVEPPRTIFGHYLKGTTKSRPRFVINGQQQQRSVPVEEESQENDDSQINRPSTEDRNHRKIFFTKRPIDLRPISEDFVEKDEETRITTGNTLRRQLHEDTTKPASANAESNDNDERSDVYGGSLSTTRPLFTTVTPSRVIQRVPGARLDRPKIYVNRDNFGPARFDQDQGLSRVYEGDSKVAEERAPPQRILFRAPAPIMPTENREFARPSNEPVFVGQQPEQYLRELPQSRVLVAAPQNNLEEEPYRPIPVSRILFRPLTGQQSLYSTTTDANVHYLTESSTTEQEEEPRVPMTPSYVRSRPYPRPLSIYQDAEPRGRPILGPIPQSAPPVHPMDDREYRPVTPEYPYRSSTTSLALPPEPPNPIAPPLSRRDFQILLRRLLVSQYGVQALTYPKTYLEDALYDQQPYPSYQAGYRAPPLTRHELAAYEQQQQQQQQQQLQSVQYGERMSLRRPIFARTINPVYQTQQYDDFHDDRFAKRVYRQKFYAQEIGDEGDEILPPPIREALLLRMLQLAINAERPAIAMMTAAPGGATTTTPTSRYRKTGPVRSVQIITDDSTEDKDMTTKKM